MREYFYLMAGTFFLVATLVTVFIIVSSIAFFIQAHGYLQAMGVM